MEQILFQVQSSIVVLLLTLGILIRKKRESHVRIMSLAIAWDIILILQIEFSRGAIAKASEAVKNTMILNIHVLLAVTTVILYGFMIYSGRKILRGDESKRPRHRLFAIFTYTLRMLTYITSYFVA